MDPSWQSALKEICKQPPSTSEEQPAVPPKTLILGPKNAGKSSFARCLLKELLLQYDRVAFIECDPGQTEFTPPGLVSLHLVDAVVTGLPFTHLRPPLRSHFIGATSPRNNPSYYISCIESLVATYSENICPFDYSGHDQNTPEYVPLVVNTMGWTKGFGADLLKKIEELVQPTHIVFVGEQSTPSNPEEPLQSYDALPQDARDSYNATQTHPTRLNVEKLPLHTISARYSPADWRAFALMSYFRSETTFTDVESLLQYSVSHPLLSIKPYAVSPRIALDSVILTGSSADDVVPSEIGRVLNGAIVAFVSCEAGSYERHASRQECIPYRQGAAPPDPRTSNCLGLGLIRGVSPESPNGEVVFHIVTPIPPSVLRDESCRCIVKGEIELPVWAMVDSQRNEGDHVEDAPYLQTRRSGAAGSGRRKVRRNVMRKSQF